MLACWVEDPNSEAYKRHLARVPDYLWIAEDGMKAQVIILSAREFPHKFNLHGKFIRKLNYKFG